MSRNLIRIASRLLALTILAGLVAIIWIGVAQPLLGVFNGYRESVAEAEEQLPRLQRLAAMTPSLKAQLAQIRRDPSARTRQLSGRSDALAAADLQNRVSKIAGSHGIVLRSTQILPPADEEGFRRIAVRVALEGDTTILQKLIYALETSPTLLFIDNVEIRSRGGGRVRRTREGAPPPVDKLFVRFDLAGYIGGTKR